ncbi:unnamed protein product [Effrenium voratum]|uniref:DUF7869 domain-containing protein n=1 Tax=Effrenium voratum TaxID=2562239 RepID=A0AA36JHR8_9DINO|nr:unnamed protein product [Effrenium voratum]
MNPDRRYGKNKGGSKAATHSVDAFLAMLYEGLCDVGELQAKTTMIGTWLRIARYPTFAKVYKTRWADVLKFRDKSLFTQCELCFQFKQQLACKSASMEVKLGTLCKYREHLESQYRDRVACWTLQEAAADPKNQVLVFQLDGCDQGKFRLPRDPALKATAALAKYNRPRLTLHGVWAFGRTLQLRVLDEPTRHDSSCIVEAIAHTLEEVFAEVERTQQPRPTSLVLMGDNTVRELKNQFCFLYGANLLARNKLRHISFLFMRKSHTHDRVDQLWGIISRRIANTDVLLNSQDTINTMLDELARPGLRNWVNCRASVTKLDVCHWQPQGVKLEGGLLEDSGANHSFTLLLRKGTGLNLK